MKYALVLGKRSADGTNAARLEIHTLIADSKAGLLQTKVLRMKAQPGLRYELIDQDSGKPVADQKVIRRDKNLEVQIGDQAVAEIEGFFEELASLQQPPEYWVGQEAVSGASIEGGAQAIPAGHTYGEAASYTLWPAVSEDVAAFIPAVAAPLQAMSAAGGFLAVGNMAASDLPTAELPVNKPIFESGSVGQVSENAERSTVVYRAAAVTSRQSVVYSLKSGGDAALLDIDSQTGVVMY